jgi:hypothetical protein
LRVVVALALMSVAVAVQAASAQTLAILLLLALLTRSQLGRAEPVAALPVKEQTALIPYLILSHLSAAALRLVDWMPLMALLLIQAVLVVAVEQIPAVRRAVAIPALALAVRVTQVGMVLFTTGPLKPPAAVAAQALADKMDILMLLRDMRARVALAH